MDRIEVSVMDISSPYYARCIKKLESLGLPTSGWKCDHVIDLEEAEFTCELCGHEGIRYVHVMVCPEYAGSLSVGCICAGVMDGNILAAKEREHEMRKRSQRKYSYLKRQWAEVSEDCWRLKFRRKDISIQRQEFRGSPFFTVCISGDQYQWKDNRRMTSFLSAQHFVFDLLEDYYA